MFDVRRICLFVFFLHLATYRIPLIDIEAADLLPIHYFVDPGPDFAWPIDEELSDEKIHLYTHYGESRMETLENYLSLSKESCAFNTLTQPSTTNTNIHEDATSSSTIDNNPTPTANLDLSTSTNETTTPVINKKVSRPSFNSFSKIIRRTFIEPFSSAKRSSLKQQQRQNAHTDTTDPSLINENEHVRRASSPLLNRRTNLLTIIVTNFQPKRPKTSDNMIKNYIDACMNEYRLEKNRRIMNETSTNENENTKNYSDWNQEYSPYQLPMSYNRHQSSLNTNRYPQTHSFNETLIQPSTARKLPAIPVNALQKTYSATKHLQKNDEMDENDDLVPTENGQFSSNINYLQQTQRKSNQLTQVMKNLLLN